MRDSTCVLFCKKLSKSCFPSAGSSSLSSSRPHETTSKSSILSDAAGRGNAVLLARGVGRGAVPTKHLAAGRHHGMRHGAAFSSCSTPSSLRPMVRQRGPVVQCYNGHRATHLDTTPTPVSFQPPSSLARRAFWSSTSSTIRSRVFVVGVSIRLFNVSHTPELCMDGLTGQRCSTSANIRMCTSTSDLDGLYTYSVTVNCTFQSTVTKAD